MDKTDRLRDYGLAFLLYEQGLGVCGYELIRELFIFVKLILNSYLSLVLVNTEKGEKLINSIDVNKVECCYSDALRYNAGLRENTTFHKKREEFFKGYREKASVTEYMQTLLSRNLLERASGFIKRKIGL